MVASAGRSEGGGGGWSPTPPGADLGERTWLLALPGLSTAGVAVFVGLPPWWVDKGVLDAYQLPGVELGDAVLSLGAGAGLVLYAGWLLHVRRAAAALAAKALWFSVLFTFGMRYYVKSEHGCYAERTTAEAVRQRVPAREAPCLLLETNRRIRPDHKFALYAEKRPPPLSDIGRLNPAGGPVPAWILSLDTPGETSLLLRTGYRPERCFREGAFDRILWRHGLPAPASSR